MRLLACGAGVFILDEPTTGITAAQARALFAALKQLASEGKTILFVSHKLDEVAELCDTVSVLRSGQVVGPQMAMPVSKERMLELMFGTTATSSSPSHSIPSSSDQEVTASRHVWAIDHVTMRDGTIELRDLQLAFQPGTVTGLAGLDGSGQQQLLRLLSGRLRPSVGQISVVGQDLTGESSAVFLRAGVHYLPADRLTDGVIGALSLTEHFVLQNGQGVLIDLMAARSEARQAIERYAIKATPNSPIASLSGGNQQRAMLALLPDQCVGVLIEQPTRGLDVASARSIWERLLARCNVGTALIFASADLDELLAYSDQVLVFFGGRVSAPIARAELSEARLAELIGGVGFEAMP
jgi:simple sugar transport system ATP-binding protein